MKVTSEGVMEWSWYFIVNPNGTHLRFVTTYRDTVGGSCVKDPCRMSLHIQQIERSRPRTPQELLQSLQMKMFTCKNTYLFGHILFVAEASETYSTNAFIRCSQSRNIYNLLGPTQSMYSILKIPYEFVDKRTLMSMLQSRKLKSGEAKWFSPISNDKYKIMRLMSFIQRKMIPRRGEYSSSQAVKYSSQGNLGKNRLFRE